MSWKRIQDVSPPIGTPVLVRTVETDKPVIAFLSTDGVWYEGGALVATASTVLGATPTEWCEPRGDAAL